MTAGSWLIARMGDRRMVLASLALMAIGGGTMAIAWCWHAPETETADL